MKWRNDATAYGGISIAFHWVMAALLVAVYAFMELRGIFPKGSAGRELMKNAHFMLGLSVLALAAARLALNLLDRAPPIAPEPPRWQSLSGHAMHYALYALMLGLPLLGWLLLSASGKPIPFFGLTLPALIAENSDTADLIKEIHEAGATAGYFLIGGHAAAALFHHYVKKDNTLLRMLPRSR
ncbi:cytochrome b [Noviherbaspirillum suwonense]|jgi:cytochrome b561|uniref:Cytochrome b561 n=1 Tax=Noviherbaspirillum suwonense TaxID=1224511 RepID=A0ABY1QDY1_9BURK|nr:cytochrome b [Noviherbaspirillum suwonense]SMP67663.1 cytochrome b561 [Noviherbaspirillum suwonense]